MKIQIILTLLATLLISCLQSNDEELTQLLKNKYNTSLLIDSSNYTVFTPILREIEKKYFSETEMELQIISVEYLRHGKDDYLFLSAKGTESRDMHNIYIYSLDDERIIGFFYITLA